MLPERFVWTACGLICALTAIWVGLVLLRPEPVSAGSHASRQSGEGLGGDPNAACADCHREIYARYRTTPMANASGSASAGYIPARFDHEASGVSYRISKENGRVYLGFERKSQAGEPEMKGRRELRYFVGSGKRGRTYLFEDQNYWFEIPINWYGKKKMWDMAPNYQNAQEMRLTMPVDPGCLRCHASAVQRALPEARNKYASEPFLQGGITCTACHGEAEAHVASGGLTAMAKLEMLEPVRRDSICLSCHLEGQAAVVHEGKQLVDFKPGDSIFDYASFFVHRGEAGSGGRATSQWEALLESGCKRGAGDKLTCTTCHDPHSSTQAMSEVERVTFYRRRCLQCHDAKGSGAERTNFADTHHPENQDCTSCHMPRNPSNDIAHEQVTDHRIVRLLAGKFIPPATAGPLAEVGSAARAEDAPDRELGLAYAQMAARGDREAAHWARELLEPAAKRPTAAGDHELHAQLGFLRQIAGENEAAAAEYSQALAADPHDSLAAGNLALLKAGAHQYTAAMELWERAFGEDPVELKAGMNLALVECGLGKREQALGTLARMLEFSPDFGQARGLEAGIRSGTHSCTQR